MAPSTSSPLLHITAVTVYCLLSLLGHHPVTSSDATTTAQQHTTYATDWTGPRLRLQRSDRGDFPMLLLDDSPPGDSRRGKNSAEVLPAFWLNLNNQGYPNISHVVVQIVRAREAGLKLLALVLSDALVVPPIAGPTKQIMVTMHATRPLCNLICDVFLGGSGGACAYRTWSPSTIRPQSYSCAGTCPAMF